MNLSKLRRPALAATAIAAVLLLLFVAFRDDPVAVDAVPVTRGPLRVTVDEDGVPDNPKILCNLARARAGLGWLDAARRAAGRALEIDPANGPARDLLRALDGRGP